MIQFIQSIGAVFPDDDITWKEELPKSLKRRVPKIWQMSYIATKRAIALAPSLSIDAVVSGTALGAIKETVTFTEKLNSTGFGAPKQFIASVHNSMAGVLAKEFNITGPNLTFCDSHNSASSAIYSASILDEDTVLVILVDEYITILSEIFKSCDNSNSFLNGTKEGAVALILSKRLLSELTIEATAPKPSHIKPSDSTLFKLPSDLFSAITQKRNTTLSAYSPTAKASSTITVCLAKDV